jgi:hypothetical protein
MVNMKTLKQGSLKMLIEHMGMSLSHICPNIQEISTPTKHTNLNGKYFFNPPMSKLANF